MKNKPDITVIDGTLSIRNEEDADTHGTLQNYLSDWQDKYDINNHTRVRILTQEDYETLVTLAYCSGVA